MLLKLDEDYAFISVDTENDKTLPLLFRQVSLNGFLRWQSEDLYTYLVWHAAAGTRDSKAAAALMHHGHAVNAAMFTHTHDSLIRKVDSLIAGAAAAGHSFCRVLLSDLMLSEHERFSQYYRFWGYRTSDVTNERVTLEWP